MRSAKAPAISAGVMIANMSWNAMKASAGMVRISSKPGTVEVALLRFERKANSKSPMNALSPPKARLNPMAAHSTLIRPMAK